MNEKNKVRIVMLIELCVCITMLVAFLYETNKLFQFFDLFLALFSMGFLFENRLKLVLIELRKGE